MSAEQKEALCKYIYDVMLQKGFTSPDGYLLVDVLTEVWKDGGMGAACKSFTFPSQRSFFVVAGLRV